jgi:hypothetical protein
MRVRRTFLFVVCVLTIPVVLAVDGVKNSLSVKSKADGFGQTLSRITTFLETISLERVGQPIRIKQGDGNVPRV